MYKLFNDNWLFAVDPAGEPWQEGYDLSGFAKVTLPHDWQIALPRNPENSGSQGFWPHGGVGWYVKKFDAPKDWQGRAVTLLFDGAQHFSTVYLNGREIGGHRFGYVPFEADMTGEMNYGGENTLCVRLDNNDTGDRWYSGMGIYRNVHIAVTDKCRIAPRGLRSVYKMDGADAKMTVTVEIENSGADREVTVRAAVAGAMCEKRVLARAGKTGAMLDICVKAPEIWDVDSPRLYELKAEILEGGAAIDSRSVRVGFREAHFDGDRGFFLNGRNIKLKGVDLHHDGGVFGAAVPVEIWRRRFDTLKKMGCNAIRCSHNPQAAEFYDLCDEMGFLVIDELYDKWNGTQLYFQRLFDADRMDDLTRMVHRDINHPSIILWSVGNEVEIQYSEAFYGYLEEMCAACRKLDPTRGVSMALISYVLKDFNEETDLEVRLKATVRYGGIVDVFMGNYMESFYTALRERGLKKAFIGSEILSYYRFEELSNTNLVPIMPWNDVEAHDWVAGGFIWAGIDYLGESTGWPARGWTGCPVDSAGFAKVRAAHLMSRWRDEPMVKIAVFDDFARWDYANGMWGFPEMMADWNQNMPGRIYHVGVFTNCDEVHLYQKRMRTRVEDTSHVRIARPDAEEHIAHFYIPWGSGSVIAEGIKDGKAVCRDELITSAGAKSIELKKWDGPESDVIQLEAYLMDEYGQVYARVRPEAQVDVQGPAAIMAVAGGDHLATDDIRRFHEGHLLIVLRRAAAGEITVRVKAENMESAIVIK